MVAGNCRGRMLAAMKRWVLALLLIGAQPAHADFPAAIEAYDQGDYALSFAETEPVAGRGDMDAQFMLGFLYARGEGVARDAVRAYLWYALAARQGDRFAADDLAALARRMTAAELAKAETLLRRWRPLSD